MKNPKDDKGADVKRGTKYGGVAVTSLLGICVLLELVENVESLLDLVVESLGSVEKLQQLGVVHLEQHTSDLTSELGLRSAATFIRTSDQNFRSIQVLTRRSSCTIPHQASAFAPWGKQ